MGYTISIEKRLICKGFNLEEALGCLRFELEELPTGEQTNILIWNEGD